MQAHYVSFRQYLDQAQAHLQKPLQDKGFKFTQYDSSLRFSKLHSWGTEEFAIRLLENAQLKVEHCRIRRSKHSQSVKSDHVTGNVDNCVGFIKALHPF